MSNLIAELLLRLVKPALATFLGLLVFLLAVALGEPATVSLVLLAWLVGAGLVLLVESSLF